MDDGPLGELRARDPGREAQVVLDPRRGPGLAPGRGPFEDHRGEALRRAVHRRSHACRPSPDDDQVGDFDGECRPAETEQLGQLAVAGITQHPVGTPNHHRRLFRLDTHLAEKRFGGFVLFKVDEPVGQAITGRELTKPAGIWGEAGSDDPEPGAELDEQGPAQQVGPQDQVCQR